MRGWLKRLAGAAAVAPALVLLAAPGLAAPGLAAPGLAGPAGTAAGVDVASFQHPASAAIGWPAVAGAGYRFAFIKETEGSYYLNPFFAADAAAAKAAGLLVAAYHFANPGNSGGALQADYALDSGGYTADGSTLPLILDIEYDPYSTDWCYGLTAPQLVAWISAFTAEAYRRTGTAPVIYTPAAWWARCAGSSTAFAARQLWVPDYSAGATAPQLPAGWTGWTYWQYTSGGTVPGIPGNTDLSVLSPAALAVAAPGTPGFPGGQSFPAGASVSLPVRSVNGAAGQSLGYSAAGLPAGLSIDPGTGLITGQLPATAGSSAVTVTVTGSGLPAAPERFTWNVHGKVALTAPAAQAGQAGAPSWLRVIASDSLAGCTLQFTAAGLPPGLTISPCGVISGWLATPGSYRPVVQVSDSTGALLASVSFSWQVTMPAGTWPSGLIRLNGGTICLARLAAGIGSATCDGSAGQQWTIAPDGSIRGGGMCLAVTAPAAAGPLALRGCRGSAYQQWQPGTGATLVSALTGSCLTIAGGKAGAAATVSACGAAASGQRFLRPAGPLASGVPGWCASSWHAAGTAPGPLTIRKCGTASASGWTIGTNGTIRSGGSCLSVTGAATVAMRACAAGAAAQRWQLTPGPIGVQLANLQAGLCLADPGAVSAGARLRLGYCVAADAATRWRAS